MIWCGGIRVETLAENHKSEMSLKRNRARIMLFFGLTLVLSQGSLAQAQSETQVYAYQRIATYIAVNTDTTIDVEEHQVFVYEGSFHVGWRSILLDRVDAITDVQVIDGRTGQPLVEVGRRLDKLDPDSWGKFTTFREGGAQNIEWYYNLADTTYEWVLRYKVHGAIAFGRVSDRLYWDIFTDYQVPVGKTEVEIILPAAAAQNTVGQYSYRTFDAGAGAQSYDEGSGTFSFTDQRFSVGEDYTIDVSWPHGVVDQGAYWRDFLKIYYGYIGGAAALLIAILAGFWRWWVTEGSQKGKGTIVPQYEPPENLRPAMAEVVTKEKLTNKGLTATIVDLAIRGFVKIEEDQKKNWGWPALAGAIAIGAGILLASLFVGKGLGAFLVGFVFIFLLLFSVLFRLLKFRGQVLRQKDYIVKNLRSWATSPLLEEYEKEYLQALFRGGEDFSTRRLRGSQIEGRKLYEAIKKVKETIYKNTEVKTKAFEVGLTEEKTKHIIWAVIFGADVMLFFLFTATGNQIVFFLTAAVTASVALWSYWKYEARLNEQGRILKEDWLGFKLYLQVAERYRMQNLTPDLFEKFLPYAMVFGVEKKWAKAFEGMHLPPPNWYAGGVAYSVSGGGAGGFSPSGFSVSFSSSFASAFSSSGAGGGGAGGGGAGGGGGGGGGGAG